MKRCPMCGEEKPLEEFNRYKTGKGGRQCYCRACHRQSALGFYHANNSRHKDHRLRRKFGLTLAQFNWMKEQQQNLCFNCGRPETKVDHRTGKVTELSVHHDHDTGRVLCLLCYRCNTVSGALEENPDLTFKLCINQRMWKACNDIDFRDAA